MITTNMFNLPAPIVNAIGEPRRPVENRFSAGQISGPPYQRKLKERYWDDITEDVSDKLFMLLGSAIHYVLEKGTPDDALAEEKMVIPFEGSEIVGVTDLYHDGVISDYKTTSVFSFMLGAKKEWEIQLNLYAWMYRAQGFPTKKLRIVAILRDWQKGKTLSGDPDYPKIPFLEVSIPMWSTETVETYIRAWIADYRATEGPCSDYDRWQRPTTYAVMKNGNKRASRVLDTMTEATVWATENMKGKFEIVERKGLYARCDGYCSVSKFCPHCVDESIGPQELL